jgi:hypothetical protein
MGAWIATITHHVLSAEIGWEIEFLMNKVYKSHIKLVVPTIMRQRLDESDS